MRARALSMRWWLALAFAGIAALTALAVAQVFTARSEAALRERAQELVAGAAVAAASRIPPDATEREIRATAARFGRERGLALFVLRPDGTLLTAPRVGAITVRELPNAASLVATALAGRRVVETVGDGRLVTVALPMRRQRAAALVAVARPADLENALGIVRDEIVPAALFATALGALAGVGIALLITRRLTRIASAAAEIAQGRFDRELRPRFRDELGLLAGTIDRMRERLRASFDELQAERDRLQQLLAQLQEGVVAVDRDLTVVFANARARALLGHELPPGAPLPDAWPAFPLRKEVRQLFTAGAGVRTVRVEPEPGRTYLAALVPPAPGSSAGVVVVTDVTEQERRERAEREFVTNAAHELRTPLSAIASAVEMLQLGAKEDPAQRDRFLKIVERQTARLTRLAHALLTLARAQTRAEAIRLEPVPLAPLLREVAEALGDQPVSVTLCCEEAEALAHRDLLQQALESLVANARKHAAGAALTLRAAHLADGRIRLEVADAGPGMPPQAARRALDRFYRAPGASGEGFGLGLPIVREVVAAMRGTLTVESREREGTTVSIVLSAGDRDRGCA